MLRLVRRIQSDRTHDAAEGECRRCGIVDITVDVELDAQHSFGAIARRELFQLFEETRGGLVLPVQVRQYALIEGAEERIRLPLRVANPDVGKARYFKIAANGKAAARTAERHLKAPDLGHHLLLGIEINELAFGAALAAGDRRSDHGIDRRIVADRAIPVDDLLHRAAEKTPGGGAARIPPAIGRARPGQIVVRLKLAGVAMLGIVVHGRGIGLEGAGEVQTWRLEITHVRMPPGLKAAIMCQITPTINP